MSETPSAAATASAKPARQQDCSSHVGRPESANPTRRHECRRGTLKRAPRRRPRLCYHAQLILNGEKTTCPRRLYIGTIKKSPSPGEISSSWERRSCRTRVLPISKFRKM